MRIDLVLLSSALADRVTWASSTAMPAKAEAQRPRPAVRQHPTRPPAPMSHPTGPSRKICIRTHQAPTAAPPATDPPCRARLARVARPATPRHAARRRGRPSCIAWARRCAGSSTGCTAVWRRRRAGLRGRRLERLRPPRRLPDASVYEGFGESPLAGRDPHAFFDHSPVLGRANPLAPPLELWVEGQVMHGRAMFGSAYEGPPAAPRWLRGGGFDEVLGSAQSLAGRPVTPAHRHYRSPTPLRTELRLAARCRGRRPQDVHPGHTPCGRSAGAEAVGLFIAIDFLKLADLPSATDAAFGPDAATCPRGLRRTPSPLGLSARRRPAPGAAWRARPTGPLGCGTRQAELGP